MPRVPLIRPSDVWPDWKFLAETVGERRAGSDAEHRCADYIQRQFKTSGLANVTLEGFECRMLKRAKASLEVRVKNKWVKADVEVLVGSPSTTPARRAVERELVWVEMPEQAVRLKPGSMKGKALAIFGPLATNTENHRKIVQTGAAMVIWIDDRLPMEWPKADAILPVWAKRVGALPTMAIALRSAYMWRLQGVNRVRGYIDAENVPSTSYNVIGDVKGSDESLGIVAFGCHYDTQVGNPGADDNGSGTVAILSLARAFAAAARKKPFKRTIRFIAFGTEEQLSVGSRAYAISHRQEMLASRNGRTALPGGHALMINLDSISSALAHTDVLVAGSDQLEKWMLKLMNGAGVDLRVTRYVTPFADHFPFTMFGVPALWFYRPSFGGFRWQHHGPHDNLSTVSPEALCRLANAVAGLASTVGDAKVLPFKAGIDPKERPEIRRMALELFDMKI